MNVRNFILPIMILTSHAAYAVTPLTPISGAQAGQTLAASAPSPGLAGGGELRPTGGGEGPGFMQRVGAGLGTAASAVGGAAASAGQRVGDDAAIAREAHRNISTGQRIGEAASTVGLGAGGAMLGAGIGMRRADDEWSANIAAVEQSFFCHTGTSTVQGGNIGHTPMQSLEMTNLRDEFIRLAAQTRDVKVALNLPRGIESEEIFDVSDLYTGEAWATEFSPNQTAQERADGNQARNLIAGGAAAAGAGALGATATNIFGGNRGEIDAAAEFGRERLESRN